MLNLNLVNGYIYISNTNALKLYNYTIKKRLMFYFIMISLFKSSSHEKKKKNKYPFIKQLRVPVSTLCQDIPNIPNESRW